MRISANTGSQNVHFNANRVNQSMAKADQSGGAGKRPPRTDTVSITAPGKANSLIETLVKQKQNIIEQKNKIVSSAQDNGQSMEDIEAQIEAYDMQIKTIDQQIASEVARQADENAARIKQEPIVQEDEPMTEEELQSEKVASLSTMASGMEQSKIVNSVITKVEGEASILKGEIQLDQQRGGVSPSKMDKLRSLESRANKLYSEAGKALDEVTDTLEYNNKPKEVLPDEQVEDGTASESSGQVDADSKGDAPI